MKAQGNIPVIAGLSSGFLKNAARYTAREGLSHGAFYCVKFPFRSVYITTDPEVIHHVFIANDKKYRKSKVYWQQLRKIIGDSIGTLEGDDWLNLRNVEHTFYKPSAVQQYLPLLEDIIAKHIISWKGAPETLKEFDITAHTARISVEIILKLIFGIKKEEDLDMIIKALGSGEDIIAWRSKYPWRPFIGWLTGHNYPLRKNIAAFDKLIRENFDKSAINSMTRELYDFLPAAFRHTGKLRRIRNEMIVHLGAGTETTAVSISWIFYLLARHPHILQLTEDEILKGSSSAYCEQVIAEALRLYPSSHALVRDCTEEDKIQGITINKGAIMYASVYGLHRDARIWSEPDVFDPERFNSKMKAGIQPYNYLPFGAGKHTCIGRYLAKPIILQTMIEIIKNFRIHPYTGPEIMPLSLATLKPSEKILLKMSKR